MEWYLLINQLSAFSYYKLSFVAFENPSPSKNDEKFFCLDTDTHLCIHSFKVTFSVNPLLISSSCTIWPRNNPLYELLWLALTRFHVLKNKDHLFSPWNEKASSARRNQGSFFYLSSVLIHTRERQRKCERDLLYEWRGWDSQHAALIISPSLFAEASPFMDTHTHTHSVIGHRLHSDTVKYVFPPGNMVVERFS